MQDQRIFNTFTSLTPRSQLQHPLKGSFGSIKGLVGVSFHVFKFITILDYCHLPLRELLGFKFFLSLQAICKLFVEKHRFEVIPHRATFVSRMSHFPPWCTGWLEMLFQNANNGFKMPSNCGGFILNNSRKPPLLAL